LLANKVIAKKANGRLPRGFMGVLLGSEKLVGEENEERMRMNGMLKIKKKDVENMVDTILKAAALSAPS
jgi:hypothetical protein